MVAKELLIRANGLVVNGAAPTLTPPPETLNVPDVLGPHHARAELTYGAV